MEGKAMAMMTLDLGGEPFLVDEETFTAIRKAESARDEYIESMMSDEDDEDDEEFEDEDEDDYHLNTVSPISTMKSIVWLNDSQYARVDSQDALVLYDDEVLEAFVGDDGEVQFMTPTYALELAEGNQIRVDSEGIWTSTWRSDAKAKKTTCGRGWIMGPGGKCVRNNKAGQGVAKVAKESEGLRKLGKGGGNESRSNRIKELKASLKKKENAKQEVSALSKLGKPNLNAKNSDRLAHLKDKKSFDVWVKREGGRQKGGELGEQIRAGRAITKSKERRAKKQSKNQTSGDKFASNFSSMLAGGPSKRQSKREAKEQRDLEDLFK